MSRRPQISFSQFRGPLLATAVALTVVACGEEAERTGPAAAQVSVSDSAGVEIVSHTLPDDPAPAFSIADSPSVVIGSVEGEGPGQLHRVVDALRLPDGRIAVLNGGSSEVRIFGPDGSHEVSFGGSGGGPSEFSGVPAQLELLPPDTILVWDFRTWETSWFLADGTFIRKEPGRTDYDSLLPEGSRGGSGYVVPGRGLLLQLSAFEPPPAGEVFIPSRELTFISRDGTVRVLGDFGGTKQVATERQPGLPPSADVPFSSWSVVAYDGRSNRVWAGRNDRYDLRQFAGTGQLQRIVRTDRQARAVADEDVDRLIEQMRASMEEAGVPTEMIESQADAMQSVPAADSMPVFGAIFVTIEGGAWVMRATGPTDGGDEPLPDFNDFDVFGPDGRWRAVGQVPRAVVPDEIGDDYLLGTRRDELGVQYVELYELEEAEPEG